MTLLLTCPNAACAELNPLTRRHCDFCGRPLGVQDWERHHYKDCIYCGRRAQSGTRTCSAHSGLTEKDPHFSEAAGL